MGEKCEVQVVENFLEDGFHGTSVAAQKYNCNLFRTERAFFHHYQTHTFNNGIIKRTECDS